MDDFFWDTSALGGLAPQPEPEPIDDFQPIKRKKAKKHFEVNHRIIPPVEDVSQISLTCTVISPAVLATHLEIPISLLPLKKYALPVREDDALRSPGPSCLLEKPGDVHLYGRGKGKIIRQLYFDGYHAGTVYSKVLDPLHTGTMWPRPFLENPEKETAHRSVGRPIRERVYSILGDDVGLPVGPEKEEVKRPPRSFKLAPLQGAPRRRNGIEIPRSETPPPEVRKRKVVTEYVRPGLRIDLEDLQVGFLPVFLEELGIPLEGPIQLAPESTRLHLFLTTTEEAAGKLKGIP
ncbi:hypothetical protein BDM02DRAFT_3186572 [Thelephora ganbajun]|uniref:Uncharacterized protein n=1 Tax=Thelephora ganbajun TaxID=370292 RepID=A0ACB6ZGV8_THEGA|nr:hypothetical protein BDM02DRAFT_3186572 [Thelephora ganbajun]